MAVVVAVGGGIGVGRGGGRVCGIRWWHYVGSRW